MSKLIGRSAPDDADGNAGPGPSETAPALSRSTNQRGSFDRVAEIAPRFGVVVALVLVIVLFTALRPSTFFTKGNALTILGSDSTILVLALGVTLTLRLGDLDLSFGAVMTVSGVLMGIASHNWGLNIWLALILALVFGAVVGAVNALLIVGIGLSSFVATLGTMTAVEGIGYGISHSEVVVNLDPGFLHFIQRTFLSIPMGVWIGWVLALVLWLLYERTPFGRLLLFIGGSRDSARLLGLPVAKVRVLAYVWSGVIYALGGVILVGSIGAADPSVTGQYLLPPLAAAFLGTTVIQLGRFNVWGTIIGAYLLATISTGLQLLGASAWVGDVFNGVALLLALLLARFSRLGTASDESNPGF